MQKVTHFIPLIGPFVMAVDKINKEGAAKLENSYVISYNGFKANEAHLHRNYPGIETVVIDDHIELEDVSVESYRKLIKDLGIKPTDIQTAVPPCAGLSMLNNGNRGADAHQNGWIYEAVKWFIAQDNKVLVLENAPALATRTGRKVLQNIHAILEENGLAKNYRMHMTKTSTDRHGIPQARKRSFLFLYKSDNFVLFKNLDRPRKTIKEFLTRPREEKPGTDHVVVCTLAYGFLEFLKENGIVDEILANLKDATPGDKKVSMGSLGVVRERIDDVKSSDEGIAKLLERYKMKWDDGKGVWDVFPVFVWDRVPAMITKNFYRVIHPRFPERPLTFREVMDLMGIPDDFILEGMPDTCRHVFQNVPVPTAADHLLYASNIVDDHGLLVGDQVSPTCDTDVLIQNNMKGDLENTVTMIENFGIEKRVKL